MSGYSFSIVTYDRGERWDDPTKKKPYHWAFFLQTGTTSGVGHAFQLRGMPGAFYYFGKAWNSRGLAVRTASLKSVSSLWRSMVASSNSWKPCGLTMLSLRGGIVRTGASQPWIGFEQKVSLPKNTPTM